MSIALLPEIQKTIKMPHFQSILQQILSRYYHLKKFDLTSALYTTLFHAVAVNVFLKAEKTAAITLSIFRYEPI